MFFKKDSFLISFLSILILCSAVFFTNLYHYPAINPDGILYLKTAQAYSDQGLHAAMKTYPWPFYSIIIASLAKVLQCSFLLSGHLLSLVLFILSALAIRALTKVLVNDSIISLLAAVIFICFKSYNIFLHQIVRDLGYWCFALWSLVFLIKFFQTNKKYHGFIWFALSIIATLFRVEGAVIILSAPFIAFFIKENTGLQKIKRFLFLESFNILIALIILVFLVVHGHNHLNQLGRSAEIAQRLLQYGAKSYANFQIYTGNIEQYVLYQSFNQQYAATFLWGGILFTFFVMMLSEMGLFILITASYFALGKIKKIDSIANTILIGYILINFIIVFGFTFQTLYFVPRYGLLFCMLLIPYAASGLVAIYSGWKVKAKKWNKYNLLFPLVAILLCISIINSFSNFGTSKKYMAQAARWIQLNVPAKTTIYTNDRILGYMSERSWVGGNCDDPHPSQICFDESSLSFIPWSRQQVIAINIKNDPQIIAILNETIGLTPIKVFKNNKDKVILIYQRAH